MFLDLGGNANVDAPGSAIPATTFWDATPKEFASKLMLSSRAAQTARDLTSPLLTRRS